MKLWVDDVRPAPEGYVHARSVNVAKYCIRIRECLSGIDWAYADGTTETIHPFELIDIDHDAGQFEFDGGDYINLLNWLEETGRNYPIHIHSMNPVEVANMRRIIHRNKWTEVM